MSRNEKGDSYKRMDSQEYENRSSHGHKKFAVMKINTALKLWSYLCFKTEPLLGLES